MKLKSSVLTGVMLLAQPDGTGLEAFPVASGAWLSRRSPQSRSTHNVRFPFLNSSFLNNASMISGAEGAGGDWSPADRAFAATSAGVFQPATLRPEAAIDNP